jgi:hypothetical protein
MNGEDNDSETCLSFTIENIKLISNEEIETSSTQQMDDTDFDSLFEDEIILDKDVFVGSATNFGTTLFSEFGESRSVGITHKLFLMTMMEKDRPFKPFTKNETIHNFLETVFKDGTKRHKVTFPKGSCNEDFTFQAVIELKKPIKNLGIKWDVTENTKNWYAENSGRFMDIMEIFRLRVTMIRLQPWLMDAYTKDELTFPSHQPWMNRCRVSVHDYIDVDCTPPDNFYTKFADERYFFIFDIHLKKSNCETFLTFMETKGSTTFQVKYDKIRRPADRKRRQALEMLGIPLIISAGTNYISHKYFEKEEQNQMDELTKHISMTDVQLGKLASLTSTDMGKLEINIDSLSKFVNDRTEKICRNLQKVADNEFIQIVNEAMDKMKEDVLKFMTDMNSHSHLSTVYKTLTKLCEKENNIKDQECESYYEGLRIYFHGIEPIIRQNGLTSLKLKIETKVPTLKKLGAISQVHSIGTPISEKEGHFFYEVIDTPKKMALSKGLPFVLDECRENNHDKFIFCKLDDIIHSGYSQNCINELNTKSMLTNCKKNIFVTNQKCINDISENIVIVSSFTEIEVGELTTLGIKYQTVARKGITMIERKENDFFIKCGEKITHIMAKTESQDYEIAPKTDKSNSLQEFWISENQYAKISSFTKKTEFHNSKKYNDIQRLIMENEDIPNEFRTIYQKMKPKSFIINLIMIAVTVIVVLVTAKNAWTCIGKEIKKRRQRRTAASQEMEMMVTNDNANPRETLQRERRARSFHQFSLNRPRR